MIAKIRSRCMKYSTNESGGVMPIFGILIIVILLLIGVTMSLSMDSSAANDLQHTADSAALTGATAFISSNAVRLKDRLELAQVEAMDIAEANADYAITDLDVGSSVEDAYGQHLSLEVELEFKPVNAAASLTSRNANVEIRRRAVANATWGFPLCLLALEERQASLVIENKADLIAPECITWANSKHRNALKVTSNDVEMRHFCVRGGANASARGNVDGDVSTRCERLPDPLESWAPPAAGVCKGSPSYDPPAKYLEQGSETGQNRNCARLRGQEQIMCLAQAILNGEDIGDIVAGMFGSIEEAMDAGNTGMREFHDLSKIDNLPKIMYAKDKVFNATTDTLTPGTYCGLNVAWGNVRMQPGVYFIKEAPLVVSRKATLVAEDVTIILVGEGAYLRVSDEARFTLTASKDGITKGFALAEDRHTSSAKIGDMTSRFTGSGIVSVIGLIYLPTQDFFFSGRGTGKQTSPLLQMITKRLAMVDESKLKIDFQPGLTDVPVVIKPERTARLIE